MKDPLPQPRSCKGQELLHCVKDDNPRSGWRLPRLYTSCVTKSEENLFRVFLAFCYVSKRATLLDHLGVDHLAMVIIGAGLIKRALTGDQVHLRAGGRAKDRDSEIWNLRR